MRAWITGAAGMLGQDLLRSLDEAGVHTTGTDREVDITDPDAVAAYLKSAGPFHWVVNCAAYTSVDEAESQAERAQSLNVEGPRILAERIAMGGASTDGTALLHMSTDYVFSGDADRPYRPDDPLSPRSVYGRTKAEGEETVRRVLARHVILRTAWLYGAGGGNFVKTMLRLMNERDDLRVVADQRGAPTWTRDLAAAITRIVTAPDRLYGTWHYTGSGETTWYEFAREIQRIGRDLGLVRRDCRIEPINSNQYPTPAARPAYSVLSLTEIEKAWGVVPPPWRESLYNYLQEEARS